MRWHVMVGCGMRCHGMICHSVVRDVIVCYRMLSYGIMICNGIVYDGMVCYDMLCYVMV